MVKTDEELQREVLRELKFDASVQPNEIGVAVKDGIVTLTGRVDSYLKRWSAEEAAHRVEGREGGRQRDRGQAAGVVGANGRGHRRSGRPGAPVGRDDRP
jgi:hypothetical protein